MDLYKDLLEFIDELKRYREVLINPDSKLFEDKKKDFFIGFPFLQESIPKKSKAALIEEVRQELVRKAGRYKDKIFKLTGKINYTQFGQIHEIWAEGLRRGGNLYALDFCIDATNEAIGKLEAEGESWGVEKVRTTKTRKEPLKAFIAHEGMTRALQKVKDFLDALGVKYLIAEIEPSDGRVVEGQVQWTQGKADFAVILATKGKIINKETGKPQMGLNVADELGRAREVFKNRIILLLQKGVEPHTNVSGIVYEPFTTQYMENVFKKIVKEIRNWGYI
jgi:predicted nucleotide-binding protein